MRDKAIVVVSLPLEGPSLFQEGLAALLSRTPYRISQSILCADDAPDELKERDRLYLVDGGTTEPGGLLASVSRIRLRDATARIAVLLERCDLKEALALLKAGADGIIGKSVASKSLLRSLDVIMLGNVVLPAEFAREVRAGASTGSEPQRRAPRLIPQSSPSDGGPSIRNALSAREVRVLSGLLSGENNKTIARRLDTSEATVKIHVKAIFRKLDVRNRTQAALWANRHWPDLGDACEDADASPLGGVPLGYLQIERNSDGQKLEQ